MNALTAVIPSFLTPDFPITRRVMLSSDLVVFFNLSLFQQPALVVVFSGPG
jgi:hypothetical protein